MRRLFTLAAVVSAVLCVAVCALWVRSYHVPEGIRHKRPVHILAVSTHRGQLRLAHGVVTDRVQFDSHQPEPPAGASPREPVRTEYFPIEPELLRLSVASDRRRALVRWHQAGIEYVDVRSPWLRKRWLSVPLWCPAAAALVPPAAAVSLRAVRRRRRGRLGLCLRCAYDLRATPQKGGAVLSRCPECGTIAPAAPGAA